MIANACSKHLIMPPLPPTYTRIPPLLNLCILFLLLLLSYGAVGYFGHTPGLASLMMVAPALLFLWYVRSLKLLLVALLAALGGTLHEVYFIQAGYWWYHIQSFWQVPAYLPFVWANIGILTVSIYKGMRMLDTRQTLWHQPPAFWPSLGITSEAIVRLHQLPLKFSNPLREDFFSEHLYTLITNTTQSFIHFDAWWDLPNHSLSLTPSFGLLASNW